MGSEGGGFLARVLQELRNLVERLVRLRLRLSTKASTLLPGILASLLTLLAGFGLQTLDTGQK